MSRQEVPPTCLELHENAPTHSARTAYQGEAATGTAPAIPNTTGATAETNADGNTRNGQSKSRHETAHASSDTKDAPGAPMRQTTSTTSRAVGHATNSPTAKQPARTATGSKQDKKPQKLEGQRRRRARPFDRSASTLSDEAGPHPPPRGRIPRRGGAVNLYLYGSGRFADAGGGDLHGWSWPCSEASFCSGSS